MEITRALVEHIVNTRYKDLPALVVENTKKHIFDILGVMFPATTLERGCIILEEITREGGGKPESTLIGFGGKVPCWMAAFVNGSLCHALDYDDTIDEFPNHPSANTFPAALAVAEKIGSVSGEELITAVALGMDLNVRLSAAVTGSLVEDYPWFSVPIFGIFSATATAGRILRLTPQEMENALGIALDRASGITESIFSPESEIRAIRDGFSNREGVFAALMAKKGINACKDGLEKLYRFFYGNNYDSSSIISDLGTEFQGLKVGLKAWPCCRETHTYIKAGLDIIRQYSIDPERIDEVVVTVGEFVRDKNCNPLETMQNPRLSINAKFSLPFVMGVVFAKKRVAIQDFFPENLRDPKVLQITSKVKPKFDAKLKGAIGTAIVEIRMKGGDSFNKREDIPYGHPKFPMSDEELVRKFEDCVRYSKRTLSKENVAKLMEKILKLEAVRDVEEITQILV